MFWGRVIKVKYGSEGGGWCSNSIPNPYGVSLWKTIRGGWPTFSHYILFEIGNGSSVKLWHDIWWGDSPLSLCFLELFRINSNKETYVVDLMKLHNGVLYWDMKFLQAVQDWELGSFFLIYGCYLWSIFERIW